MPQFFFEADPAEPCPATFGGDTAVLAYFVSLAFSTRYGSQHELSRLALILRGDYKIDLKPLTTFADRNVEEDADRAELERVWQDAAPLAATLQSTIAALESGDGRIEALAAAAGADLLPRLREMHAMAAAAARRGARVRLTFAL